MKRTEEFSSGEIESILSYAGLVLLAFELVKGMIVDPIKEFYTDVTFGEGLPFKSYEEDVQVRHRNIFEASLLYLRDFMEAIDSEDLVTIQAFRKHRNDLAHNLPNMVEEFNLQEHLPILEKVDKILFKLSNYRLYMEVGSDPRNQNIGINWDTIKGPEYEMFETIKSKLNVINTKP